MKLTVEETIKAYTNENGFAWGINTVMKSLAPDASYDLTSSQSEIKDASIVITKSFLINSHADILTESPNFENEITKKLKNLHVVKKSFENSDAPKQIDENDNVNELISISQIPSVIQTLDFVELVEVDKVEAQCTGIKSNCTIKRTKFIFQ
jgi:acyl CoA:acetate/3-ketoacid CoA transferase